MTQKWSKFDHFPNKPILTKLTPYNDIFDQIYLYKLDWNNFFKLLEIKLFDHFPQILTYDASLAPKMTKFLPFHLKWPILTKFTPINDIFDHIYFINLTETFRYKIFWQLPAIFDLWRHFGPQNDPEWPNFDHFHKKT